MSKKSRRKRTRTPAARKPAIPLEQQIAAMMVTVPDLHNALSGGAEPIDDTNRLSALFERLVEALVRAYIPTQDRWTLTRLIEARERIDEAITDPAIKELICGLDDAESAEDMMRREAAYLVGVEVGRRLAGGAR